MALGLLHPFHCQMESRSLLRTLDVKIGAGGDDKRETQGHLAVWGITLEAAVQGCETAWHHQKFSCRILYLLGGFSTAAKGLRGAFFFFLMRVAMFISGSLLGFFFFCVCVYVVFLLVLFVCFCHTGSLWKFLGQGSNLRHTASTRATAVRRQEPQPARPSENSLRGTFY